MLYFRLVLLFLLLLTLAACNDSAKDEKAAEDSSLQSIKVSTIKAKLVPFDSRMQLNGITEASQQVLVSAKTAGQLTLVKAALGQQVQEGQTLATLDDRVLRSGYEQAKAAYDTIREKKTAMKRAIEESKIRDNETVPSLLQRIFMAFQPLSLPSDGGQTTFPLTSNPTDSLRAVELQLKQAEAAMELARLQLEAAKIVAPFAGTVTLQDATQGATVAPGMPLFQITNLNKVNVILQLNSFQVNDIRERLPVTITFDGVVQPYKALVNAVSPVLHPELKSYTAKVVVPNPNRELKPGMLVTASVELLSRKEVIALPHDAIFTQNDERYVYVIKDGLAQKKLVQIGEKTGKWVEVKSGLEVGQIVVLDGKEKLATGTPVEVVEEIASR